MPPEAAHMALRRRLRREKLRASWWLGKSCGILSFSLRFILSDVACFSGKSSTAEWAIEKSGSDPNEADLMSSELNPLAMGEMNNNRRRDNILWI
mmetsp:Transcript_15935/g.17693  ORF Transcript_15935/g.17693 Transcript_15935/m.17693 type:complete len:95 (-) Transcript_15935:23-307(-)